MSSNSKNHKNPPKDLADNEKQHVAQVRDFLLHKAKWKPSKHFEGVEQCSDTDLGYLAKPLIAKVCFFDCHLRSFNADNCRAQ